MFRHLFRMVWYVLGNAIHCDFTELGTHILFWLHDDHRTFTYHLARGFTNLSNTSFFLWVNFLLFRLLPKIEMLDCPLHVFRRWIDVRVECVFDLIWLSIRFKIIRIVLFKDHLIKSFRRVISDTLNNSLTFDIYFWFECQLLSFLQNFILLQLFKFFKCLYMPVF